MKIMKNKRNLIILWCATLISCLIIFHRFIFGSEFPIFKDVGSDTLQQYLAHYNTIINHLRNGNLSLWDFNNGFGTSMFSLNLFHPFLWLIYLAGTILGPMRVPMLLVYFQIGQILLAVTAAYFYLNEFSFSNKSKCIAAYLFGFNGYLLIWGQHYQFGFYVVMLPILLLLVEKALKKKGARFLLALAVFFLVISGVYMTYMSLLMVGIYLLLRIFFMDDIPFKQKVRLFLVNCGSILVGLGMAMISFLPNAYYILNISSRLETSDSVIIRFIKNLGLFSSKYYALAFNRLFSSGFYDFNSYNNTSNNYYEAPVLCFSVLFVILLMQYLFTIHRQNTSKRTKLMQYTAIVLCFFFVFIKAGTLVFNAFAYPFSRHTFILMPLFALISAQALDQILNRRRISYIAFGVSGALFILLYYLNTGASPSSATFLCLIGLCMTVILFLIWQKRVFIPSGVLSSILILLVMVNVVYDSYNCYNDRSTLSKEDGIYFEKLYGDDITRALNYLKDTDTSFYRIEKDYDAGSYCMDSLTLDYYGVSTYNSAPNKNVMEFVNKLWPNLKRMNDSEYSYRQVTYDAGMASLLNIKYLISENPKLSVQGFSLLKQFGTYYIYRNENTGSIGTFYTNIISAEDIPSDTSALDIDHLLAECVIVEDAEYTDTESLNTDIFENYPLETLDFTLENQNFKNKNIINIPLKSRAFNDYQRVSMDFDITLDKDAVLMVKFNNSCCHYIKLKRGKTGNVRLTVPLDATYVKFAATDTPLSGSIQNLTFSGSKETIDYSSTAQVTFEKPVKDSKVNGTVITDRAGLLFLSIPFESGWKAYVDGQETTIQKADYGFMGLSLTPGTHQIELRFTAPGLIPGACLSAFFFSLYLILLLIWRKRERGDKRCCR